MPSTGRYTLSPLAPATVPVWVSTAACTADNALAAAAFTLLSETAVPTSRRKSPRSR